jgi:exonuclease III
LAIAATSGREHDWWVLVLSDTRIHDEREIQNVDRSLGAKYSIWTLGTPNSGGTAILFFKPVLIVNRFPDPGGRFCRAYYIWEVEEFSVFSVYAPADSSKRRRFFSDVLKSHIEKHRPSEKCFLAGDFNFVENPFFDRTSDAQGGTVGNDQWADATVCLRLTDLFRHFYPRRKTFTFRSQAHKMQSRIDRAYCSEETLPFVGSCKHVSIPSII